jgi:hypothetical protein
MSKLEFGLTMLITGTGGTLVSLYVLSLMVQILKRIFPREASPKTSPEVRE